MSVCRCVWVLFMTAVVVMSTCDGSGVSNSVISSSSGSSSSFSVSGTGSSHSSSSVHADGSGSVGSVYQSLGGVVSLKCGPGDSIVWYKVNDDKSKTELSSKNGATHAGPRIKVEYTNQGSVLTISNTKEEDSGTYICETGMTAQRKTHQYTITVGSGSGGVTSRIPHFTTGDYHFPTTVYPFTTPAFNFTTLSIPKITFPPFSHPSFPNIRIPRITLPPFPSLHFASSFVAPSTRRLVKRSTTKQVTLVTRKHYGTTVFMMCLTPRGANITWLKKGENGSVEIGSRIKPNPVDRRIQLNFTDSYTKLTIRKTIPSDNGIYSCQIQNNAVEWSHLFKVVIGQNDNKTNSPTQTPSEPPSASRPAHVAPYRQVVDVRQGVGASVTLHCQHPPGALVYWYRLNGNSTRSVIGSSSKNQTYASTFGHRLNISFDSQSSTLELEDYQTADSGRFVCTCEKEPDYYSFLFRVEIVEGIEKGGNRSRDTVHVKHTGTSHIKHSSSGGVVRMVCTHPINASVSWLVKKGDAAVKMSDSSDGNVSTSAVRYYYAPTASMFVIYNATVPDSALYFCETNLNNNRWRHDFQVDISEREEKTMDLVTGTSDASQMYSVLVNYILTIAISHLITQ